MKSIKTCCCLLFLLITSLQAWCQHLTPEKVAQGQLDAYNKQDIDGFLSWYADDVEVYNFPGELVYKGKEQMRKVYTNAWARNPRQRAQVTSRMRVGNTVMDKEHVTGRANGAEAHVIAIYKVENGKIRQVYFVRE